MIISDQYQFIFIHIPKTEGRKLISAFEELDIKQQEPSRLNRIANQIGINHDYHHHKFSMHDNLSAVEKVMPDDIFKAYFKFTVVRNPWDKLIVEYQADFNEKITKKSQRPKWLRNIKTFKEYVHAKSEQADALQYHYVTLANGEIGTDYIARQEHLSQDFKTICDKLNIHCDFAFEVPQMDCVKHNFVGFYSCELFEFVEKHWQKDIQTFNYTDISYTTKLGESLQKF